MTTTFRQIHTHLKCHHKKYLFGIFGGYAIVKLFLLVFGVSVVEYFHHSTFADLASGCTLTGQYYTGEYLTGGYLTGQVLTGQTMIGGELTGGYLIGCTTVPGYWTGGTLDESGTLVGQTRVEETETGCILTGQTLIGGELTGGELTGGYRTGGYITGCLGDTGIEQTGTNQTGTSQTGVIQTGSLVFSGNGVCEAVDIIWNAPISGSVVRNIFPISWVYSGGDCLTGLSLQLWDHNNQWITLTSLTPGSTGYTFNSKSLYSFQQSGLYHIIGTGTSGQYYLYTGTYTGTYSRVFSGYKLRLITSNQTSIFETQSFTINNETPTLNSVALVSSGSTTGALNVSGVVTLNFIASQPLSGVQVTLGSSMVPTSSVVTGLAYSYTWTITSGTTEGPLVATINFSDAIGNTGLVIFTGGLIFDKTFPVVSGFVFSGYASGVYLNFNASEAVRYVIEYQQTSGTSLTGSSADYLTAQQFVFSGIERSKLYTFTMTIYDRAGNMRLVTGDVLQTTLGTLLSHVSIVPIATTLKEVVLSGTLSTLAVVLKAEIEKFNVCKNSLSYTPVELNVRNNKFTIQMPIFQKAQMKTLVNAFTLFVLDKVKQNASLGSGDIAEITKKFDSFLVILKLLRDDDNACKQNLSNYHINQFQRALAEYNITM